MESGYGHFAGPEEMQAAKTHTHTLQSNSYYLSPMSYYSWIYDCESQGYKFVP